MQVQVPLDCVIARWFELHEVFALGARVRCHALKGLRRKYVPRRLGGKRKVPVAFWANEKEVCTLSVHKISRQAKRTNKLRLFKSTLTRGFKPSSVVYD